eukprot:Tbor_TRINITY_DN5287_c0_g1::TRINITY_DN5287_c0_g1_i2::g.16714::m.16714
MVRFPKTKPSIPMLVAIMDSIPSSKVCPNADPALNCFSFSRFKSDKLLMYVLMSVDPAIMTKKVSKIRNDALRERCCARLYFCLVTELNIVASLAFLFILYFLFFST